MAETRDIVTVERVIPSPPGPIFELIADPGSHRKIDGSGTVRDPKGVPPEQLELGTEFGMAMRMGIPYSMVSTVIEYEKDRRVAWQTRPPSIFRKLAGGRIWRYELEPVDGGTRVRESWDISEESPVTRGLVRRGAKATRENMEATLERIEELVTG